MRPLTPLAAIVAAIVACESPAPSELLSPTWQCRVDGMLVPTSSDSLRPDVALGRATPDPRRAAATPADDGAQAAEPGRCAFPATPGTASPDRGR